MADLVSSGEKAGGKKKTANSAPASLWLTSGLSETAKEWRSACAKDLWSGGPDQADGQALQMELIAIQVDVDRLEIRVLGN